MEDICKRCFNIFCRNDKEKRSSYVKQCKAEEHKRIKEEREEEVD